MWAKSRAIARLLIRSFYAQELYSQKRDKVGVMFAGIPNFHEFYSEENGKAIDCMRLLNEIISKVPNAFSFYDKN